MEIPKCHHTWRSHDFKQTRSPNVIIPRDLMTSSKLDFIIFALIRYMLKNIAENNQKDQLAIFTSSMGIPQKIQRPHLSEGCFPIIFYNIKLLTRWSWKVRSFKHLQTTQVNQIICKFSPLPQCRTLENLRYLKLFSIFFLSFLFLIFFHFSFFFILVCIEINK